MKQTAINFRVIKELLYFSSHKTWTSGKHIGMVGVAIDSFCRPCGVVQLFFLDSCIQNKQSFRREKMKMNIHGLKMYGIKVGPYICIPVCYLIIVLRTDFAECQSSVQCFIHKDGLISLRNEEGFLCIFHIYFIFMTMKHVLPCIEKENLILITTVTRITD